MTDTTTEPTTDAAVPAADTAAVDAVATAEEATVLGSAAPVDAEAPADVADAPVIPEAYELVMPEGVGLDAELLAEATPVFKEIGLTNETASKLMPFAARLIEKTAATTQQKIVEAGDAQRKAWLDAAKAAGDIGGGNWGKTIGTAAKGLDAMGFVAGSPFRQFLEETGMGNHPDMIRIAAKLGELTGEDGSFARADAGAPVDALSELYPNNRRSK